MTNSGVCIYARFSSEMQRTDTCDDIDKCDLISAAINLVLGCLGGFGAKSEKESNSILIGVLGLDQQALSAICSNIRKAGK